LQALKKAVFFNTVYQVKRKGYYRLKKKKIVLVVLLQTTIFAASITDRGLI
jgi:hypothetical protein